tara:strand:+ start:1090 stop:1764 length:675 start_codon:yes stop_codon:yes gene_type:complete
MEDNLEEEERNKYNGFVDNHSYGSDYERTSATNRLSNGLGEVSEKYLNILKSFEDNGDVSKVLDIGSGPGGVMNWVESFKNIECYGIDISDSFIDKLKINFPDLSDRVYVCNAKDLSRFDDNNFDLVQHTDGMEHIPPEWEVDCLKEAIRVSNKFVLYETALGDAFADSWVFNKCKYKAAHINIKSRDSWMQFYEKYSDVFGFKIISSNSCSEVFSVILEKINE